MEWSDSIKFLGFFKMKIFHGKTILNLQKAIAKKVKKIGIIFKSKIFVD